MTEPTLESLNEAAKTCGYVYRDTMDPLILELIRAHALTLDKLHNRKEVSEAETFYREVVAARLGDTLWKHPLDGYDREAIALIEAKFAELRADKECGDNQWNVPEGQTPLDEKLRHRYLDVIKDGELSRDSGKGSPYSGQSLEHCLHSTGWLIRDLRLALDAALAPKGPEWVEWYGGECPVAEGADCEVKFRARENGRNKVPGLWYWRECGGNTITAYRVFP